MWEIKRLGSSGVSITPATGVKNKYRKKKNSMGVTTARASASARVNAPWADMPSSAIPRALGWSRKRTPGRYWRKNAATNTTTTPANSAEE